MGLENAHILESDAPASDQNSLIAEFENNNYDNDLLFDAVRQRNHSVAIAILKKDGFVLDTDKHVDGNNLFLYAVNKEADELIETLLNMPFEQIKRLIVAGNSSKTIRSHVVTNLLQKDRLDLIERLKNDFDLKAKIDSDTIYYWGENIPFDTLNQLDVSKDDFNLKQRFLHDGFAMNIVSYAIWTDKYDFARKLVKLDVFDPLHNDEKIAFNAYRAARKWEKYEGNSRHNKEKISDLILKRIKEKNPRRARKLQSGFLGTGLGGHRPQ